VDEVGDSTLHYAVREGHENILQLLLQCGANAELQNEDDETAMQLAHCLGEQRLVEFFLQHNPSIPVNNIGVF